MYMLYCISLLPERLTDDDGHSFPPLTMLFALTHPATMAAMVPGSSIWTWSSSIGAGRAMPLN